MTFKKYLDAAVGILTPVIFFFVVVFPSDRFYSKAEKYHFIKLHLKSHALNLHDSHLSQKGRIMARELVHLHKVFTQNS